MQALDAFGYWPNHRSRVRGLGGAEQPDDPNYVFHSNYAAIEPGPSVAEVSFEQLSSRNGMIAIRVFQYVATATPQVTEQARTTALLPSLAHSERPIRLAFEAIPGAQYAVNGHVFGECDARAKGVAVAISARSTEEDDPARARSQIGRLSARRVVGMSSVEPPTLAWPVSQAFTRDQTRERDFDRLTAQFADRDTLERRWETAFIVRVLESYGRLDPAARGLGLSLASDPAAAFAATAGCDMTSVLLSAGETIEEACTRAFPDPARGRGFDFLWTRQDVFGAGGSARALSLIGEVVARLRPGGLGIHVLTTGGEMDDNAIDRVVVGLSAMGHIVAQVRHAREDRPPPPYPFGIVVRKATEVLD